MRITRGLTLGPRFIIVAACTLAAAVAILIVILSWVAERKMQSEVRAESRVLLSSSAHAVASLLAHGDAAAVQELVETLGENPDVESVRLYDRGGTVTASNRPSEVGSRIPEPAVHDVLSLGLAESGHEDFPRADVTLAVAVRRSASSAPDAALFLRSNLAEVKRGYRPFARTNILAALAIVVVLGAAFLLLLSRWVLRPLNDLAAATSAVAAGDTAARAPPGLPGQIGDFAVTFNAMMEEMDRNRAGLLSHAEDLEGRVRERTESLVRANADLAAAYEDLKRTQGRLVQSARMASVGQLAAGVAHEINNPVAYIKTNLTTMERYIRTIRELAAAALTGEVPSRAGWREDLDLVIEDIGPLVSESLEGTARVESIVKSLKGFSHVDTGEISYVDINALIDDTLRVVANRTRDKVRVEKLFGDIPLVRCMAQRLNQVFLNIILNATEAVERDGVIRIATRPDDGNVVVEISDNGCGIPAELLPRIFEPFFTTKDPGKGTGLGLSISYDIVKTHGGDIGVESTAGGGTRFTLWLPVHGPREWKK